jgi:methionyl-tRNA formyltransferase
MIKTVVLASNRTGLFEAIRQLPFLHLKRTFAVENSSLHRAVEKHDHALLLKGRPEVFFRALSELDFDIFISNGCPFILPVSKIQKPHQLFLNVHPSLLPEFRGYHPANGALLHDASEAGATLHTMVDQVDRGTILAQDRFPITPDLDLDLLYHLLFDAETRAFTRGMKHLAEQEFHFAEEPQAGTGSHYRRTPQDMRVDFATMSNEELFRRIRAFGITSQGVHCTLHDGDYTLFEARLLNNPRLLELHERAAPGHIVQRFADTLIVRSRDSLIRVSRFAKKGTPNIPNLL